MLKNLDIGKKIFIFPLLFMFVMIICAFLYHNSISYVENRTSISENANVLAKDLLNSRISVYQFMLVDSLFLDTYPDKYYFLLSDEGKDT